MNKPNYIELSAFKLSWSYNDIGFGELRMYKDEIDGHWKINSESMGKEFVKRVLCDWVDNSEIV